MNGIQTEKSRRDGRKVLSSLTGSNTDAIAHLVAVARKEIVPSGLSSLSVNMTVVEILDAAHKSARTGRRVDLKVR